MTVRYNGGNGYLRPGRAPRPPRSAGAIRRHPRQTDRDGDRSAGRGLMRFLPIHTLRSRLILLIGLPLLLLQLSVIALEYAIGRADELHESEQRIVQQTHLTATDVDMQLALVTELAKSNAGLFAEHPKLSDYERHRVLRRSVEGHSWVYGAALAFEPWVTRLLPQVYRPPGAPRIEAIDLNRPNYDIRREPWYRRARTETEAFWIGPHLDPATDTAVVSCVVPILRQGGFAGTVTVSMTVDSLTSLLARSRQQPGLLALIDPRGAFLVSADGRAPARSLAELAEQQRQPMFAEIARRIPAVSDGTVRVPGEGRNQPDRLLSHRRISTTDWSVLALVSDTEALEDVHARLLRQGLLQGFGTAAILSLLWWATAVMTRPLQALAETAQKVAEGKLDTRVEGPLGDDEIGRFSRDFNRMIASLEENVAARLSDAAARQAVESELAIGLQIQRSLLPKPYDGSPAVEIAGDFMPARFVAGDFYDWFQIDRDTIGIVIADVSGKGVPAALFMAVTRTMLRSYSASTRSPAETLMSLNGSLFEDNAPMMFVTAFYGRYHIPTGRLTYANAGHNPPYIIRANGAVESLGDSTGPLLAVFADARIADREAQLQQGDGLVLYTDGVTDATDPDGRMYDEKRLELVLKSVTGDSAAVICERIRYAVGDHCKGPPQDDVTLLVLRRNV